MAKRTVQENSFEGAPGGGSGTLNYQTGYGTPSGGNTTQNPSHFSSSDKTTNHFAPNTASGSAVPKMPDQPDRKGNSGGNLGGTVSPAAQAEKLASEKPLDPDKQYDGQVDQIFQKKQTPSPDEIMSALQYELSNMVKKDKTIAKQQVLKNLKTNPHYYSRLDMLNIDDDKMKVDEDNSTFSKTKAVLDEMIASRKKSVAIANTPEITEIFKDLTDRRLARKGRL
jgi:hypothetical protein